MICNKKAYTDLQSYYKNCEHYKDCVIDGKMVGVAIVNIELPNKQNNVIIDKISRQVSMSIIGKRFM